jgi:hypothetical protein
MISGIYQVKSRFWQREQSFINQDDNLIFFLKEENNIDGYIVTYINLNNLLLGVSWFSSKDDFQRTIKNV